MCSIAYRTACWQRDDLRIFGMQEWLRGIYQQYIRLYLDFGARREKRYIVADFTNLALGLLRNGIAYAKAAATGTGREHWRHGISAVLLGGQRVYGMDLRHDGNAVHAAQAGTRELDAVREFLDYEEVFCMEEGKPLVRGGGGSVHHRAARCDIWL